MTSEAEEPRPEGGEFGGSGTVVVLGLLAPPQTPGELVERLAAELPGVLSERVSDHVRWKVPVVRDSRVPDAEGGDDGGDETIDDVQEWRRRKGWDLAVCVSDPPLLVGGRVVVAEVSPEQDVALLSAPALGAGRRRRRAREAVVRLVGEVFAQRLGLDGEFREGGSRSRLAAPVGRVVQDDDNPRLVAPAGLGRLRLLAGMVRANRPFRVVLDLSYALVAALGTAAFTLISIPIWQLSGALGWTRLLALMFVSVAAMVVWLIFVHDLWERPSGQVGREHAPLFNATTVITLTMGALSLYAALFALTFAAAGLIIEGGVLGENIGRPAGPGEYITLAWIVTSLATLGGTLGSGLETSVDVREAAYSYHRERRSEDEDGSA